MHNKNSVPTFLAAATLLIKLTTNIVENPRESKYRTIRMRNPQVVEKLLKCVGADEALEGMGWIKRVIDMEERLFWEREDKDLERLQLGLEELRKYVDEVNVKAAFDPKEKEQRERKDVLDMINQDKETRARAEAAKRIARAEEERRQIEELRNPTKPVGAILPPPKPL